MIRASNKLSREMTEGAVLWDGRVLYGSPVLPVMPYKWPALGWAHFAHSFIVIISPIFAKEECSHFTSIDCRICLNLAMYIVDYWRMKSNLFLGLL